MRHHKGCGRGGIVDQFLRTANFKFALSGSGIAPPPRQERPTPQRGAKVRPSAIPLYRSCSSFKEEAADDQASLDLETYTENALINDIRGYLESWRALRNPADWGVTGETQRLLDHWRHHEFNGPTPFFCQVEAVETIIWLTEVAAKRAATKGLLDQIAKYNEEANPGLFRLAMKMATGSGKTTVMAMLIAWQTERGTQGFEGFLTCLPDHRLRHHHPRSSARAASERGAQLL